MRELTARPRLTRVRPVVMPRAFALAHEVVFSPTHGVRRSPRITNFVDTPLGVCVRTSARDWRYSVGGAHATAFRSWPGSGTKPRNMGMRGGLILSGENKYSFLYALARPQLSWNPDGGSRINSRLEPGTCQKFAGRTLGKDPS